MRLAARASPSTASGNAYVTGETLSRRLPDHRRRVPAHAARRVRRLRHEAEPDRLGARRTRRSSAAPRSTTASRSRSTAAATPTCSASRARPTSRPRRARSTPPPTARFDATADQAEPGRLGARLLDLPRRQRLRRRPAASPSTAPATRTSRAVRTSADCPDHARRVRHDVQQRRRLRHEVQPGRLGARLLDLHRRLGLRLASAASSSTRRATPGSPAARARPTSRSRAGAPDTTFNGGGDAIIAELNPTGSALLFSTFLGGSNSEGGADIARDPTGDIYVTGSTFSQDFPATVGAFDRVWNGDLADLLGRRVRARSSTSTPRPRRRPRRPACRSRRRWSSPSNASSQPQPITFDWNDAPSAVSYTIQIDDSSAFSAPLVRDQSVTTSVYATTGLPTGDALLARSRRQLGRRRRAVVGGAQLHAAGAAAARGAGERWT